MKKLITTLALILVMLTALGGLSINYVIKQGIASKSDLMFLLELGKKHGLSAVVAVVKLELYGVDESLVSDPSYGREQIAGRGHAPWVIRGNLDTQPRMLKFALQPGLWAAYDTQQQSLYQVWEGDVLFEGAAYNYKHGPQPSSTGSWYLRDEKGSSWFIERDGVEMPATVIYLGHEYGAERKTAAMRFALQAQDVRVELTEQPEITEDGNGPFFTRTFKQVDGLAPLDVGFRTGDGERYIAAGTLRFALTNSTPLKSIGATDRGRTANSSELERGKIVIANSDCLGCHGEQHKIAGPAWSQISSKFEGRLQEEVVDALTRSVLQGSVGIWGQVAMPPHPQLSAEDAEAAVAYILRVGEPENDLNSPVDDNGQAYVATDTYSVLPRLQSLHPSFKLENLAPKGFEAKVGGMAFREDGKLVLSSWDKDGAVFLLDFNAPLEQRVTRIAEGLQEPLGLTVVGNQIFVLQKQELTELIDNNGDEIIDRYRTVGYDWPANSNFHSFSFGLLHQQDNFYFLLSICVLPGGASCPDQEPTQGKLLKMDHAGNSTVIASGFRTPNGITSDPSGDIFVTDNQGDWLPASKLLRIREGGFYGSRAVPDKNVMAAQELPPIVWLPQDEVGNSPTQPLLLQEGPYAGQMIHGDVYNGGIKRVFMEEVGGELQGAAFHFSAGFQGPVNRLVRGPDDAIYIGGAGSRPNWGEFNKPWHGLQRISYLGNKAFEIKAVRAQSYGFELELTQPLASGTTLDAADVIVKQWFYHPNEQYGGPKYDETELHASALEVSQDRLSIRAKISGLKPGYVVYLRLPESLRSATGSALWTAEAWYTLNKIPAAAAVIENAPAVESATGEDSEGWQEMFDGETLTGWRNYGGDVNDVQKWSVSNGTLTLNQAGAFPMWDLINSVALGGPSGDLIYYPQKFRNFELSLQWKISENGNSGIFYLVTDETENTPWLTGIEMQVLDNDGHSDGKIHTHRAGDLYDLIAAEPETVRAPGEWNDVRIRIKDNHIEHWLNGQRVVDVERGGEKWNTLVAASKFKDMPRFGKSDEGYIVLQDHGDPVWYRNIRVRPL
ncbi:MAG: cytochrome c551/c552 [Halioglobus sp.]|jgi:cytochrome c551/c552